MNGFVFPFRSLMSYRRNRRDLCRQFLAQILAEDAQLVTQRNQLWGEHDHQFEEIRKLNKSGRVSVDGTAMRRYHTGQLQSRIAAVEQNRRLLAQQLQLCRRALMQADGEVKVLERLEEKQRAAFLYEAERRAQLEREDGWTARRLLEASR
jgi:flagellar export protein FliJ